MSEEAHRELCANVWELSHAVLNFGEAPVYISSALLALISSLRYGVLCLAAQLYPNAPLTLNLETLLAPQKQS